MAIKISSTKKFGSASPPLKASEPKVTGKGSVRKNTSTGKWNFNKIID